MSAKPGDASQNEFAELLAAARNGDERAWTHLYGAVAPQVLGFLRGRRAVDPEDILGEAFVEVARRIGTFKGDARGFRAWVFTIARARLVDDLRRRIRRPEEPFDPHRRPASQSVGDVEEEALAVIEMEDLLELLDLLTEGQREVLLLRTLGGWSSREIGEITGRTPGAVDQLHFRAVVALRKILSEP
jgi:RNA polymerase sigma-70 factor (ECF subfamily)